MRLKQIDIYNFLSYNQATVNLEDLRKVLIVGVNNNDATNSNGSGKTNLCEAIGWAVWGQSKAKTLDLNVKEGQSECSVAIEFEHDGKLCYIKRTRNKDSGTTTIDFKIDGEPSNGRSVTETDKKIIDILKVDYQTYINSVYIRQDDIFSLANPKKQDDGRAVLESVLNLEEYEKYEALTKLKIKETEKKITELSFFLESNVGVQVKIDDTKKNILEMQKELSIISENLNKEQEKHSSTTKTYELQKESFSFYNSLKEQISRISKIIEAKKNELENDKSQGKIELVNRENRKKDLENKISEKENIDGDRTAYIKEWEESNKHEEEMNNITAKISSEKLNLKKEMSTLKEKEQERVGLNKDIQTIRKELDEIKETVKNINIKSGEKCKVCLSDITEHNIELIKQHNKDKYVASHEKLTNLIEQLEFIQKEESNLIESIKNIESLISQMEKDVNSHRPFIISKKQYDDKIIYFNDKLSQIDKYKLQITELPEDKIIKMLSEKIKNTKIEIENNEKHNLELKEQFNKIKLDTNVISKLEEQINNSKQLIDSLNKQNYTIQANIKNLEKNILEFDIILSECKDKQEALDIEKDNLVILEQLEKAFGSRGVRAKILEDAIRDLEKEADILLKRLSNGRLSLSFVTEKSDKIVFEIQINDGEKTLPFSLFSGGEKFRIAFVLRIALSKLLLRKANSKLEFLIIDEAVAPLDINGTENIMAIINELQDEFKTILFITHRNDIKSYFDSHITVYRDEEGSKII